MSLIWCESFDCTPVGDLATKWTAVSGGVASYTTGRTGTNALNAGNDFKLRRAVASTEEDDLFILGAGVKLTSSLNDDGVIGFMHFLGDAAATTHVFLCPNGSNGINAYRGTPAGSRTLLGSTASNIITIGTWHFVEFKARLHDSAGSIVVEVDGVEVLNLTGQDTKNGGTDAVFDNFSIQGNTGAIYFDDVYACNEQGTDNVDFLGPIRVRALNPDGAGATTGWSRGGTDSGANWSQADEDEQNGDTDYVFSSTDDQKDTYSFENLPAGADVVFGVQIQGVAKKTDAGARTLALVARSGASETDGADQALSDSAYDYINRMTETKPGGGDWTPSTVDSAEFGVKCRP